MTQPDLSQFDFSVDRLGPCRVPSPLQLADYQFIADDERTIVESRVSSLRAAKGLEDVPAMETAGPRAQIFHAQYLSRAAIVTCGGLCRV